MVHTCGPEQFKTVRVKTRKHKDGWRLKNISYYVHTYKMTYEEVQNADIPSFMGNHPNNDNITVNLIEPPYVKCKIQKLQLLHYIGVPIALLIGAILATAIGLLILNYGLLK